MILANCSVPLLGLADTAVLGNLGTLYDLGAIAFGTLIFSFVYWGFGFFRMGTTGFVAQADGRGDGAEVRAVMLRSLIMALVLGVILTGLQVPLAELSFYLLGGGEQVRSVAIELLNFAAIYSTCFRSRCFSGPHLYSRHPYGTDAQCFDRHCSFLVAWLLFTNRYGIAGLWMAFHSVCFCAGR